MNLKPALYIVIAMIIAVVFFGGRFNLTPTSTPTQATTVPPATIPTTPPATQTTSTPPTTTPTAATLGEGTHHEDESAAPTPSHDGGENPDWKIPENARQGSITITQQFITGWLEPDPKVRRQLLAPVTAQALIEELAVGNLKIWNTTPAKAPQVVEITSTDAMTRQAFTDGRSVDLLLAAEPGTPHGWIITDIQPTTY